MKKLIVLVCVCIFTMPANAQILKKLKDKVNKTVENAVGTGGQSSNEGANKNTDGKDPLAKINWCDTISSTKDNYTMAYSSPVNFRIMYDESRLCIGRNKSEYRIILKQSVDNKTQFVIIDNGKVTATVSSMTDDQIIGGVHQPLEGLNGGFSTKTEKYILMFRT